MVDFEKGHAVRMAELKRTESLAANSLTLRDYFAAAALQGMMASAGTNDTHIDRLVKSAYMKADAMMRERDCKQSEPCSVEEAFGL